MIIISHFCISRNSILWAQAQHYSRFFGKYEGASKGRIKSFIPGIGPLHNMKYPRQYSNILTFMKFISLRVSNVNRECFKVRFSVQGRDVANSHWSWMLINYSWRYLISNVRYWEEARIPLHLSVANTNTVFVILWQETLE